MLHPSSKSIVFFDSQCVLCSKLFRFLVIRDNQRLIYTSIHSKFAQTLIQENHLPKISSSLLVKDHQMLYQKSAAVFKIASEISFPWKIISLFNFLPHSLLDSIYDFIALRRNWWGKRSCILSDFHHPRIIK